MKKLIIIIFLFYVSFSCFSQEEKKNVDNLIQLAIEKKIDDYYDLYRFFQRKRFNKEDIDFLLSESQKKEYRLGEVYAYNLLGRH